MPFIADSLGSRERQEDGKFRWNGASGRRNIKKREFSSNQGVRGGCMGIGTPYRGSAYASRASRTCYSGTVCLGRRLSWKTTGPWMYIYQNFLLVQTVSFDDTMYRYNSEMDYEFAILQHQKTTKSRQFSPASASKDSINRRRTCKKQTSSAVYQSMSALSSHIPTTWNGTN